MTKTTLSPADKQWGFSFGVDGLLSIEQAATFLGVSQRTIYRLIDDDSLRAGYVRGKKVICRRSVTEYLRTVET